MSKKQFMNRRKPFKQQLPVIHIYCEGINTEPDYFKQFRVKTVKIRSLGIGDSTLKLVETAIKAMRAEKFDSGLDQKWCVFDKDDSNAENFNLAIAKAGKNGFNVAWSNQAFEYWFLLHFEDHQGGPLHRDRYTDKINGYIDDDRAKYNPDGKKKVSPAFFLKLNEPDAVTGQPRVELAIKRSKRIYDSKSHLSEAATESCTTVHKLVEVLREYME